jgi:hypothetical protein
MVSMRVDLIARSNHKERWQFRRAHEKVKHSYFKYRKLRELYIFKRFYLSDLMILYTSILFVLAILVTSIIGTLFSLS